MATNYFNKNIKKIRTDLNKTVAEFSKIIGINQSTIYRWENNEVSANVETAFLVAEKLNIPIYDLVGKDLSLEENVEPDENHKLDYIITSKTKELSESEKKMLIGIMDSINSNLDKK